MVMFWIVVNSGWWIMGRRMLLFIGCMWFCWRVFVWFWSCCLMGGIMCCLVLMFVCRLKVRSFCCCLVRVIIWRLWWWIWWRILFFIMLVSMMGLFLKVFWSLLGWGFWIFICRWVLLRCWLMRFDLMNCLF